MKTPSSVGSTSSWRSSSHRRISDYLADDQDYDDSFYPSPYTAGMLPFFLADHTDLVEVTLELDDTSMVVRSVTPTEGRLSRSSSAASRLRRKFGWLRSPSPRPPDPAALASRDARRIQARLERTRSGAQRALRGLRFISQSTAEAAEMWRDVEERFTRLARDGLLSREDFGECIGMLDSKDFALGVFDALARRRRQNLQRINREELLLEYFQHSILHSSSLRPSLPRSHPAEERGPSLPRSHIC